MSNTIDVTLQMCTASSVEHWHQVVGFSTTQQHAFVSQRLICSSCTCCHTTIKVAHQTCCLTQSQYADTRQTSPSADPIMPGAWHGSHWYDSTWKKIHGENGNQTQVCRSWGWCPSSRPTRWFTHSQPNMAINTVIHIWRCHLGGEGRGRGGGWWLNQCFVSCKEDCPFPLHFKRPSQRFHLNASLFWWNVKQVSTPPPPLLPQRFFLNASLIWWLVKCKAGFHSSTTPPTSTFFS